MPQLLSIVEETGDYIVVDKPGDLVCHPTKDGPTSSLIGRLRLHLEGSGAEPRFVNRLDRETSGLVVVSKNRDYHRRLCRQMESARKRYWAVVEGRPDSTEGLIDQPLGKDEASPVVVKQAVRPDGRPSRTRWRLLASHGDASLLELELETGRMHQIRVHLAWLGHPLVGDKLYGADETLYLELAECSWTPRLRDSLASERQLLSALEIITEEHRWAISAPSDLLSYRPWSLPH
jgi:23S rRNA pseudouridine1911/1915/1917 synthase